MSLRLVKSPSIIRQKLRTPMIPNIVEEGPPPNCGRKALGRM